MRFEVVGCECDAFIVATRFVGVPTPVISAALFQRFESRGEGEFTGKVLSAMRSQFGGHAEKRT